MLFMAIVSTGSAESIAVSSLVAYDIYRQYINPNATGADILKVSRIVIVAFGLFMGALSIALYEIGLNLGWVYLFMGVVIGSAVMPLWFMMTWSKASGTGAVVAAWGGFSLAVAGWLIAAKVQSGEVTVATLGSNEVMLSGNLIAILSSGIIHIFWSLVVDKQEFDFSTLNEKIKLVEDDLSGLTAAEQDKDELEKARTWITRRGYVLTVVLIIVWPVLSVPAKVFSESYFAFWVLLSIVWGFGAAVIIAVLPILESLEEISKVLSGMWSAITGKHPSKETAEKEDEEPVKEVEA